MHTNVVVRNGESAYLCCGEEWCVRNTVIRNYEK